MKNFYAFLDEIFSGRQPRRPIGDDRLQCRPDRCRGSQTMRRRSYPRKYHEAGGESQELELDGLLPGIKINTSATDFAPIKQLQLMRFKGESWELFGPVMGGQASG